MDQPALAEQRLSRLDHPAVNRGRTLQHDRARIVFGFCAEITSYQLR
jgi:hypothetical protein